MWEDFKAFAIKGNALDMAIGVIIGTTFGKIVTSLVENMLTPLLGLLLGGIDFTGLQVTVGKEVIGYGWFLQSVFDFLIIAFSIFMFMRVISKLDKGNEEKESLTPTQEELLEEILDLLKIQAGTSPEQ